MVARINFEHAAQLVREETQIIKALHNLDQDAPVIGVTIGGAPNDAMRLAVAATLNSTTPALIAAVTAALNVRKTEIEHELLALGVE